MSISPISLAFEKCKKEKRPALLQLLEIIIKKNH